MENNKKNNNNNSSNSLVFGQWPQTKIIILKMTKQDCIRLSVDEMSEDELSDQLMVIVWATSGARESVLQQLTVSQVRNLVSEELDIVPDLAFSF